MNGEAGPGYRRRVRAEGLCSFRVVCKQTDLWVSAPSPMDREVLSLVLEARHQIEGYMALHPEFATTLVPMPQDPFAPPVVRAMIEAAGRVEVGPMAAVAGAIAEHVGRTLPGERIIVENGGDLFLRMDRPVTVALLAGNSPLSGRLGLRIHPSRMPLGIGSSSATVGHSLSLGKADLACVLAVSGALADGAATALGNRLHGPASLQGLADWGQGLRGVLGAVGILGDRLASWGDVEFVTL